MPQDAKTEHSPMVGNESSADVPPIQQAGAPLLLRQIEIPETASNPSVGPRYFKDAKMLIQHCVAEVNQRNQGLAYAITARIGAETIHQTQSETRIPELKVAIDTTIEQLIHESQGSYQTRICADEAHQVAFVLVPLTINREDAVVGSCIYVLPLESDIELKLRAAQLQAATQLIHSDATALLNSANLPAPVADQGPNAEEEKRLIGISRAAKYGNITEFAFTLVNSIAQRFELEQTSLGLVDGNRVKLSAVSGMDTLKANSPGIVEIEQVMTETLDHGRAISYSVTQPSTSTAPPIHRTWARSYGNAVASIPIYDDETCVAILCIRRHESRGLSAEMLEDLKSNVSAFGPAIKILHRSQRPLSVHAKESAKEVAASAVSPKSRAGFAGRLAIAAVALFFLFGWMPYRPTATCTIVPTGLTHSLASFDMVLKKVHVRSGDVVRSGALLAEFDDRQLLLERDGLIAQRDQSEIEIRSAIASRDAATATLAKANVDVLTTKLKAVEERIRRCKVTAPVDGMVVKSDLQDRIGQVFPQGQQILSFAPMDAWTLELQIPEHLAPHVKPEQVGTFASISQPYDALTYRIESISGNTEVVDGRNVFIASAKVDQVADWMRFGMEGVAATETGWRPVCWVALHRVWEIGRLKFWV